MPYKNGKPQVLIAEDDRFLGNVLKTKIQQEGFDVRLVADGEEALAQINAAPPDILLLDVIMPKKNGFDVLAELRLKKGGTDIPVIILSNLGQEDDVKRGLALGAIDFLVKSDHSLQEVVNKVKIYAASAVGVRK
ncbi:MAG: response regulator [Patescibacteria group bacterium]